MAKISIKDISFGESEQCSINTAGQDIIANGKVYGSLMTQEQGWLKPLREWHQICIEESEASKFDWHSESEDKGFIFGCFEELTDFVKFINQMSPALIEKI